MSKEFSCMHKNNNNKNKEKQLAFSLRNVVAADAPVIPPYSTTIKMNWIFFLQKRKKGKTKVHMTMIQQEYSTLHYKSWNVVKSNEIFHADCVWCMDWVRTGGWLDGARHVHIVQVHALFTNPKTHKIIPNGGAAVGELHIKTMKVNGHNSYAHHVTHIILSAQNTCVQCSSLPLSRLFPSFFIRFVCLLIAADCGRGKGMKYYVATNDDVDKPSKYEKERVLQKRQKNIFIIIQRKFCRSVLFELLFALVPHRCRTRVVLILLLFASKIFFKWLINFY